MIGRYNGGKGRIFQRLINLMPPHSLYVEAFLGGGAVLLRKRPASLSIGIDLDWAVCRDWERYLAGHGDGARASIVRNGDAGALSNVAVSAGNIAIVQADAVTWLETAVLPSDALVYADPPYLLATRSRQRSLYRCEMLSESEHAELLHVLLSLDCMVMISGYWSSLYAEMLAGWETAVIPTHTRSGRPVEEWVWMNYDRPIALHDYSFLGDTYRDRERIARKKKRWLSRLAAMPPLERQAIVVAIEEKFGDVQEG